MISRPAIWVAGVLLLCVFVPQIFADQPDNGQVDREIDEITSSPDYDWLRGRKAHTGPVGDGSKMGDRVGKRRPVRSGRGEGEDCGYRPSPQGDPPPDRPAPQGEGCDSGSTPGAGGGSVPPPPAPADEGCSSPSPGSDCGCNESIGDCGCDRALGSCSCTGIGAAATPLGYIVAALALAFIVFLVVRAIINREPRVEDAQIEDLTDSDGLGSVRVSEVAAIPTKTMMDKAAEAAGRGEYKVAVGWCYLAGISRLHRGGYVKLEQSTTNWEIIRGTRRNDGPHEAARDLIRVFEDLFFGGRTAEVRHWEQCRSLVQREIREEDHHES